MEEEVEGGTRRETTLANSSAKLEVLASTVLGAGVLVSRVLVGTRAGMLTGAVLAVEVIEGGIATDKGVAPVLESDGAVLESDCCNCVKTGSLGDMTAAVRGGVATEVITGVTVVAALLVICCEGGEVRGGAGAPTMG